jgi:transposase
MELSRGVSAYLYNLRIDMRSSFDRLSALVTDSGLKSRDGSYFVFIGRNKKKIKILYWDRDGYCIWQKRLEAGGFKISLDGGVEQLSVRDLELLLVGMEHARLSIRKRFSQ